MALAAFVGATALFASPLRAQYPSVPPPLPCVDSLSAAQRALFAADEGRPGPNSIGVVAFWNSAPLKRDEFLGEGLAHRLVVRLRAVDGLDVTETRKFGPPQLVQPAGIAAIGAWLHARYLLVGSVGRVGGDVSVAARLLEAESGATLWRFSRVVSMTQLPGAEQEVVAGVLAKMGVAGLETEPAPRSVAGPAYEHFLRGAYAERLGTAAGYRQSVVEYDSAVRLDGSFAPAAARLGGAYAALLYWGWWDLSESQRHALISKGLTAVDRATELDSSLAESWAARGVLLAFLNPASFAGVRPALRRALASNPRQPDPYQWYGRMLYQAGDDEAARVMFQRALGLAPRSASVLFDLARLEFTERRFENACVLLDRAVAADPLWAPPYALRARTRLRRDQIRSAWADAETAGRLGWPLWGQAVGAVVDARARDTTSARARTKQLLQAYTRRGSDPAEWQGPYLAIALSAAGQRTKALDLLSQVSPRGAMFWTALRDPDFAAIASSPRFRSLQARARPQ